VLTLGTEWIKLRSVRSSAWSVVAIVGLTVLLSALICSGSSTDATTVAGDDDIVEKSLGGAFLGQIAVVGLGTLMITAEYATRTIRTTFMATPRRRAVILAKAAVLTVTTFVAGLLACGAALVVGQWLLRGNGYVAPAYPPVSLTDGPTLRAVLGTASFLTGVALLSLGVGVIVRHTAAAISVVLGLLLVPLIAAQFLPVNIRELLMSAVPSAGLEVQSTVDRADNLPIGPWAGLAVTFAWAAAAVLVAMLIVDRRDA
jgi:ABC-2 type transport system permease protein